MPDEAILRRGVQRLRIDVTDEDSIRLWSTRFDVAPSALRRAVLAVGPFAMDVERELHKSG